MKKLIVIAALIFSGLCSASNIELRDNCESLNWYIPSQDEVNAVVDCLYNKRHEQIPNRAAAISRLSSVSPLFAIDLLKLTQSIPVVRDENYYRYYIETVAGQPSDMASRILMEHYKLYATDVTNKALFALIESLNPSDWKEVRDIAVRQHQDGIIDYGLLMYVTQHVDPQINDPKSAIEENITKKQNAKLSVERNIINRKYDYIERLSKKDPPRYLQYAAHRMDELESSLAKHFGENIKVYHKGAFRDDYRRLGDYAVNVAGDPEKAIDFYLKEAEFKVVPRKLPDDLSESERNRYRKEGRETLRALQAMGAIGGKPNTPCYKIYELLGNNISKRHRAYSACHDELKGIGIPLISIFNRNDDDLALEQSTLRVKVKLINGTDGDPLRYSSKVLVESAYSDLDEHFCNELQLVDTNSNGVAMINVRKNRLIRAALLDQTWTNDKNKESMMLSRISTHKDSTRFNEIVLHVKPVGVGEGDKNNNKMSLAKISSSLKDCRDYESPSQTMEDIDKLLYLLADYSIANPRTTRAESNGFIKNAALTSYHEEIAFADELNLFRHGVLHRLVLAPEQYSKSDVYNLEMGILLDQVEPLAQFIEKYGTSALNSYFGDECSFASYVLSAYSSRKIIRSDTEKVLRLYVEGHHSHISRDKFESNKIRYENAMLASKEMEEFHSSVIDFSIKNNLAYGAQQTETSCNKIFIDEFLMGAAVNNDVNAIRFAVNLGVSPNYTMSDGSPYIAKVVRSQDIVVELFELGADPMIQTKQGTPLFSIALNQKYKKIITYYIDHDLIAGIGVRSYVSLFDIEMDDPETNRKLLSHLAAADNPDADEIVQAAAVTGRADILGKVFDSGYKIKRVYESPVSGRHNSFTSTLDGLHDEFLVLNALQAERSDDAIQVIDILVNNGANVNSHSQGDTALSYSARFGTYELVHKLISIGADPLFVPPDGIPVILNASKRNLGFSHGCFTHLPIIGDAVKSYLDENKDAPDRDEYEHCRVSLRTENTPAQSGSDYKLIKLLIDNNVDVNVSARFGMTPLMLYALKHDDLVVDILLKNGADSDAKDAYGNTYLDYRKDAVPTISIQSPTGRAFMGEGTVGKTGSESNSFHTVTFH